MDAEPKEEDREGQQHAEQRVDCSARKLVDEVGSEHQEPGMGQVHDLHHAVNDRHADRHRGIDAGQQQRQRSTGSGNRRRSFRDAHSGLGLRRDRLARRRIVREDDVHLVAGLVLDDHEGFDLAVLAEAQHLAGQQRVLRFRLAQLVADGRLVEAAGALDRHRQHARRVVGGGRIPGIGRMAGERLIVLDELLDLRIGELRRPPDAGERCSRWRLPAPCGRPPPARAHRS